MNDMTYDYSREYHHNRDRDSYHGGGGMRHRPDVEFHGDQGRSGSRPEYADGESYDYSHMDVDGRGPYPPDDGYHRGRRADYRGRDHGDREYSPYRDRDRDRNRDRDRSPRRSYRHDRDGAPRGRRGDYSHREEPSDTILVKRLSLSMAEDDILTELKYNDVLTKDVRVVRHTTGQSRGFAFIEFHSKEEAVEWMDRCKREMYVGELRCPLFYSIPRGWPPGGHGPNPVNEGADWFCIKCGAVNFARREKCFRCQAPKSDSNPPGSSTLPAMEFTVTDGSDQIGTNPCNTLLLQGLDGLTSYESIQVAFLRYTSSAPPKNAKVMMDPLTNTSLGYAFVEFTTLAEARKIMKALTKEPLEIDGKLITVNYAKNTFTTVLTSLLQQQQQEQANYEALMAAKKKKALVTQSKNNYVSSIAVQQAHALSQSSKAAESFNPHLTYNEPDVSKYQYDASSGYYYDPDTTLYYDPNSSYYYNSQTQQYFYWDSSRKMYLPAAHTSSQATAAASTAPAANATPAALLPATAAPPTGEEPVSSKAAENKKERVKHAKKVAKEMENWAKKLNKQKQDSADFRKALSAPSASATPLDTAGADAGFAILQKAADRDYMPPPTALPFGKSHSPESNQDAGSKPPSTLVASYGGDDSESDGEQEVDDESRLVDWTRLTCLLCKRQFNSKDILDKHLKLSDLHKQNIAKLRAEKGVAAPVASAPGQYRDRAQERRQKYGVADPPAATLRAPEAAFSVPQQPPPTLTAANKGNKLLQKMGWSEGQGLGKDRQGRVNPVEAEYAGPLSTAGLGSSSRNTGITPTDTYKTKLKKTLHARYGDL